MNEQDSRPTTAALQPQYRIWALTCPFTKQGVPVMGSFGSQIRQVVIIPVATWTRLCQEIPGLAATTFEVGSYE